MYRERDEESCALHLMNGDHSTSRIIQKKKKKKHPGLGATLLCMSPRHVSHGSFIGPCRSISITMKYLGVQLVLEWYIMN